MGRWSTGAQTCEGSLRIELSYLLKSKLIEKGKHKLCSFSWSNGSSIGLTSKYIGEDKWIQLSYCSTDRNTGEKTNYDYKIYLTTVLSNLGKGEVLYFICPVSGKKCRVLYKAYGYDRWKSREAYRNRLFYKSQLSSKMNYPNDRYWAITRKLEKIMDEKHLTPMYNGERTRKFKRIEKMREEQERWDHERWLPYTMPLVLRRRMFAGCSREDLYYF